MHAILFSKLLYVYPSARLSLTFYAALLPILGPLRRTLSVRLSVCLSVCLSVRPSVPLSSVTSRHLANYSISFDVQ